jgi:hypothetical protein
MLDLEGIHNTLQEWVADHTGLDLVWPGVNATSVPETDPYLAARITSLAKIGDDTVVRPEPENDDPQIPGAFVLMGVRELVLSLQGVRSGSLAALETLRTSLDLPDVREWMQNADAESDEYTDYAPLAWIDAQPIRNLNGLVDVSEDERWLLEIRFRTHSELVPGAGLDVIESVEGEGTVNPGDNEKIVSLNAAVPDEE